MPVRMVMKHLHADGSMLTLDIISGYAPDPAKQLFVVAYQEKIDPPAEEYDPYITYFNTCHSELFEKLELAEKAFNIRRKNPDGGFAASGLPTYEWPQEENASFLG